MNNGEGSGNFPRGYVRYYLRRRCLLVLVTGPRVVWAGGGDLGGDDAADEVGAGEEEGHPKEGEEEERQKVLVVADDKVTYSKYVVVSVVAECAGSGRGSTRK